MLSDNARRFDLYDFFSVLLPGVAFLLSLVPFLPQTTDLGAIGAILPLIVGGFVFGRAIHSLAIIIEDEYQATPTHRERFIEELKNPVSIDQATIQAFYDECTAAFDFLDKTYPWDENTETNETQLEDLYGLVRSYIHIDARGRSRTFQAVYSFYRSMWIVSILVAGVYILYGIFTGAGVFSDLVQFTTFIGSLGIPPGLLALGGAVIALFSFQAFSEARPDYQGHFIRYMFADFLVLQGVDYPEAVIAAEPRDEHEDE